MTTYQEPPNQQPAAPMTMSKQSALLLLVGLVALIWMLGGWALMVVVSAVILMIVLHELGHYITAKKSGMKVTEYFLGFGPRLWSFKKGETEYGVKALPFGAYVRIIGMNNLDEVAPEDEPRTYRAQSYPKRFAVGVAGSAMHFLQALVCMFVFFALVGVPGGSHYGDTSNWRVDKVSAGSAAAAAGLQHGDRIVAIDGQAEGDFTAFRDEIAPRPNQQATLTVERNGTTIAVPVVIGEQDGHGFLGVQMGPPASSRLGLVDSTKETFVEFGSLTKETVGAIGHIFSPSGIANLAGDVVHPSNPSTDNAAPPTNNGSATTAPASSSSSTSDNQDRPVSIIGALGIGAELTRDGAGAFLLFFAAINIMLGLVNLIPLPPLDGGHIAVATYERIRSRNGRRYRVDMAKLLPLTYAVVMVLVFIGVSAMFLDIVNPVHLN